MVNILSNVKEFLDQISSLSFTFAKKEKKKKEEEARSLTVDMCIVSLNILPHD